jgi:hypothetical protein
MKMSRKWLCEGRPATLALIVSFPVLILLLLSSREPAEAAGTHTLPDGRSYEQVSPVGKNGADVDPATGMAAVDGNRFFFVSKGSFAGQPTSLSTEYSPYLATRGPAGWTTEGISLPNGHLTLGNAGYQGFTPDLSKGVIQWQENGRFGPFDPSAPTTAGFNSYIRDNEAGSFTLASGTENGTSNSGGFVWGSRDFSMIALSSLSPLAPSSGCPDDGAKYCAYESENGVLRLASVLPNGEPVEGAIGNRPFRCNFEHAVSDDGHRLFFTSNVGEHDLYAREDGISTTLISASERTLPGGASGNEVNYQSAEAAHGDKVLFTTKNSLVDADGDSTNDLYMYDYGEPAGQHLTLISEDHNPNPPAGAQVHGYFANGTPEGCGGLVGASEDLRRVYFVANNQITPGGPEGTGPKLYLWDDTGASPKVVYLGTLDASTSENEFRGDARIWAAPAIGPGDLQIPRQARWSRDGRFLAFISTASLTGFDNEGEPEVFRYDAVAEQLSCATCVADSRPSTGTIAFNTAQPQVKPVNHLPANVSDSGEVFFSTARGLLPEDSNGQVDVYEYDGALALISAGSGASGSFFLDASPSGSDAYFITADRLVGWDRDSNIDVYDARVGGGFPEPGFVPPPCEGEACLEAAQAPNDATPGSSSYSGAGNVMQRKKGVCPRHKVRRQGKCRKRNRQRRQPRRQSKTTTRSHG